MSENDWTEIRLSLAASGKTVAEIEKIVDRWFMICEAAGQTNDNDEEPPILKEEPAE